MGTVKTTAIVVVTVLVTLWLAGVVMGVFK